MPQYIGNNFSSVKHRATEFDCSMRFSAMADRMVWPPSLSRDSKWPRVTKCTHSRVVGLRSCYRLSDKRLATDAPSVKRMQCLYCVFVWRWLDIVTNEAMTAMTPVQWPTQLGAMNEHRLSFHIQHVYFGNFLRLQGATENCIPRREMHATSKTTEYYAKFFCGYCYGLSALNLQFVINYVHLMCKSGDPLE